MHLEDKEEFQVEEKALIELKKETVQPADAFKAALYQRLRLELGQNRSSSIPWKLDENGPCSTMPSAPCPFPDFCWAKLPMPRALKPYCPCLKFGKILQKIATRTTLLRLPPRPCPGLLAAEQIKHRLPFN